MSELIFRKVVDQSLLKEGTTIPAIVVDNLLKKIELTLTKGQKHKISIIINEEQYDAILTNVNFSGENSKREVVQIRYSEGSAICQKLKSIFLYSEKLFSENKQDTTGEIIKTKIHEANREYIEIYAVGPSTVEFRCIPKSMKADFLKYLGKENDLSGYQRSYKLVFYKAFFELAGIEQEVAAYTLTRYFQQFYINRKQKGLVPDINTDYVITEVENSSLESIYSLILKDPFAAISSKGFFTQTKKNGKVYFCMNTKLHQELNKTDREMILTLVNKKIDNYFSRIDHDIEKDESMREVFNKILNEYIQAKKETFAGHPMGTFFRSDVPNAIYKTGIVSPKTHLITGSVGQGQWANIPWVCIFDRSITTSATRGIYIVYLLAKDGKTLYLTFNQGCTDIRNSHSKNDTIKIMRQKAAEIVSKINSRGFSSDENINLGDNLTELAELYQKGTIFYKAYRQGNVPPEDELRKDLANMMDIYSDYVNEINGNASKKIDPMLQAKGEKEMPISDIISNIKEYIAAKGFIYWDGLIENFYLCLKSKPFVILAGTSGTGKTRLVKLFAEAIGAEYKLVSIRPDWSDGSDLFGHYDLNGKFIMGPVCECFDKAMENPDKPVFLCLDEMNLARVEYYLSDFLSVIESREKGADGRIVTSDIAQYKDGIPDNLYIVGTVNMDETTFPFSKKVLDRANTIEFNYVDLDPTFSDSVDNVKQLQISNAFLRTQYLVLARDCVDDSEYVRKICYELQEINQILLKANAHIGYRVRDEIVFYMLNNKKSGLLTENTAMDNEIMQKILPRIQGSSASVKNMLCDLFKFCAGDYDGYQTENNDISSKMISAAKRPDCKYKKSAEKIAFMVRRYEEDGFTSYWL